MNFEKYFMIAEKSTDLAQSVKCYFEVFNKSEVFIHSEQVAQEVIGVSRRLGLEEEKSLKAAYLHDVGRVITKDELPDFCEFFGEYVTPKERENPSILHQKASKIIAEKFFGIQDIEILEAVQCHTTLKANPTDLAMAVFLADKLSWQEQQYQRLVEGIRKQLMHSKEKAVLYYLEDMHRQSETLAYYHEWSQEAYAYFKNL